MSGERKIAPVECWMHDGVVCSVKLKLLGGEMQPAVALTRANYERLVKIAREAQGRISPFIDAEIVSVIGEGE